MANDTEIRSFVYPFNQSHGHKLLTHIEDNARIIGMDALFHHQKFIWATQFNPGGIFYKDSLERGQTKTHAKNIVSMSKLFLLVFIPHSFSTHSLKTNSKTNHFSTIIIPHLWSPVLSPQIKTDELINLNVELLDA